MSPPPVEVELTVRFIPPHSINPNKRTKHHRKPKSIEGKSRPPNTVRVPRYKHESWHTLVGNASAEKVFKLITGYYDIFGTSYSKTKMQQEVYNCWISLNAKKHQAWKDLFEGMFIDEIIHEINTNWIDPEYKMFIVKKRSRKTCLTLEKIVKS